MASQALADAVAAEEEKLAGEGRVLVLSLIHISPPAWPG